MGLGHRQVLRVLSVCARNSRADVFWYGIHQDLGLGIVGYLIPVWVLAFVGFGQSGLLGPFLGWL